jgi:hypothetical protein
MCRDVEMPNFAKIKTETIGKLTMTTWNVNVKNLPEDER